MRTITILFLGFFLFVSLNESNAQYRDAFAEKKKSRRIKKRNKRGLFSSVRPFMRKERDPFRNISSPKGLVGLGSDPFAPKKRVKYKPTGVDKDSFNYKQRRRSLSDKYNKQYVKNKSLKSRQKHYKLKMKYG
tara:strand:+ start:2405 stop:2803 length:399 start_codon:yes stop_codon:yes gene_type:complete